MAARDDLLRELRLLPRWTLRLRGRRRPSAHGTSRAGAAPAAARDGAAAGERQRPARIAALDWGELRRRRRRLHGLRALPRRQRSVPGVGDVAADWLFVGEAPGAEEDAQGEPFVGQAGALLDSMLAALGLVRGANVYIANVLKCRPPKTARRSRDEVDACRPYLDRQIELIRPKLIVALGKSAATTLLDVDATIASLRGRVHRYRDVPLVVTYHPAYLLRKLAGQGQGVGGSAVRAADAARCRTAGDALAERSPRREIACILSHYGPIFSPAGVVACLSPTSGGIMIRKLAGLLAVFAMLALAGCGYNDLQRQDEGIKAAWSEVVNQYQRRADLVPNLVNTVKGYAAQEQKVLTE